MLEKLLPPRTVAALTLPALALLSGLQLQASPPLTVNTAANQVGRLTSVGNGQARHFYEYDALGRTTHAEYRLDLGAYVFASVYGYPQNPTTTSGPGSTLTGATLPPDNEQVTYTYDAGDLQIAVDAKPSNAPSQSVVSGITRNARGKTTSMTFGNGVVTTHSYNDTTDLRLHEVQTVPPGAGQPIQDMVYGFDANGNITSLVMTDAASAALSATYGYDSLDQLTSMTSGGTTVAYGYDSAGNLTVKEGAVQAYAGAGRGPHALATAGGVTYGYDLDGNLQTTTSGLQITWNAENLPETTTSNGALVNRKSFLGEEMWKRADGTGLTTLYMPSLRIEGGQPRKFFGTFAERSPDGSLEFYHPDQLGSSTLVTNQLLQVSYRAAYMPFGGDRITPGGTFIPPYRFNFKEQEATGFYNFGARMYNPATGRWLSPDSSTKDGPNRYTYVNNNPLLFTDPTGHQQQVDLRDGAEFEMRNGVVYSVRCQGDCARERQARKTREDLTKISEFILRSETTTLSMAPGPVGWVAFALDTYLAMKDNDFKMQNPGDMIPLIILATSEKTKVPRSLLFRVGQMMPRLGKAFAGKEFPLPEGLRAKYPNVHFSPTGYPDMAPYAVKKVTIRMTGTKRDFGLANLAAGFGPSENSWQWVNGEKYVWHHGQDKATMYLIPQDLHNAVPHTGGNARVKWGGPSSAFPDPNNQN